MTIVLICLAAFLLLFFLAGLTNLKDGISRDPFGDFLVLIIIGAFFVGTVLELADRLPK